VTSIPQDEPRWTLDELAALVGLPKRTVRYYIQLGLVDRPEGETRAARYGWVHAGQLRLIRQWTDAGLSLERVRELLAGEAPPPVAAVSAPGSVEVKSHLAVADGIELVLDPTRAGLSPEEARDLFAGVMALYQRIKQGGEKP
jgi:DNA-binding transcriptional MerR regulator